MAILEAALTFVIPQNVIEQNDTPSFIIALSNYNLDSIYSFIDFTRPPVYPLFIGFCKMVTIGNNYLITVALMQWIVFIISIHYFKNIAIIVIGSRPKLIWCITLFYTIWPGCYECNYLALTESLSMTCLIFFLYTTLRGLTKSNIASLSWSSLWLAILLLIKPAFIYLLPLLLIGWAIVFFNKKRIALYGIGTLLMAALIFSSYCLGFQHKFGFFAPSIISVYNSDINVRMRTVSAQQAEEAGSVLEAAHLLSMKESVEGRKTREGALQYYTTASKRIDENFDYLITLQISRLLGLFTGNSTMSLVNNRGLGLQPFTYLSILLPPLSMRLCIYTYLIYVTIMLYTMIRKRFVYYIGILISTIWFANLFVAWWGSWGDYGRLNQAVFPLFLIMLSQLLSIFSHKKSLCSIFCKPTS